MREKILKISNEIIDLYESVSGEVLWKQNQVAIEMITKLASEIEPYLLLLVSNFLISSNKKHHPWLYPR